MSNFKEIYPQKNFIENLHRMDSIEDDKEMGIVYTGPTDDAPTSAEYIWEEIINTKKISGKSLSIKDCISMPVYSYKIYGNATQSSTLPADITSVGTYSSSTNTWNMTFKDGVHTNTIKMPQPLIKSKAGRYDYITNGCIYYNNERLVLIGTENWLLDIIHSNDKITSIHMILPNTVRDSIDIYSSHFKASTSYTLPNQIKIENYRLYLTFDKKVVPNLDKAKEWLNQNNVLLYYPLKFERKVPIEQPIVICTKEGTTSITNNQSAQMDIEYRITPNALLYHKIGENEYERVTA